MSGVPGGHRACPVAATSSPSCPAFTLHVLPATPGGFDRRSRFRAPPAGRGSSSSARGPRPESPSALSPRSSRPSPGHCRPGRSHPSHCPGLLEAARADGHGAVQWSQRHRLRRVCQRTEGESLRGQCSPQRPQHSPLSDARLSLSPQPPRPTSSYLSTPCAAIPGSAAGHGEFHPFCAVLLPRVLSALLPQ